MSVRWTGRIIITVMIMLMMLVATRSASAKSLTPYERWSVHKCAMGVYVFYHPAKGTVVADPPRKWCVWTVLAARRAGVKAGYARHPALAKLVRLESGFSPRADNPTSTAFGLYQFLDSTWASYGCRFSTDPVYQSVCGIRYIEGRYRSPSAALRFHLTHNWY